MNEYYGIASTPTDDFLAHYGIKGMKWGVRKAISKKLQNYKDKRIRNKIIRNSRSAQFHDAGGYMAGAIAGAGKNSERQKISNKWNDEYERRSSKTGTVSDKTVKDMDNKYRKAYVHAVLKDSKIPITKKNVNRAYQILRETDKTFARNYKNNNRG